MKNDLLKKILPHAIAIVIFLVVSLLFCKPALDGNELNQHDIKSWKAMAQNAFEYKAQHGHFPLWNPNLFGGMPNYQVAMEGKSILPDMVKVISLGTPKPVNFFFVACLCFYILCIVLRARPVIAIFGALAFAFATYNPIIISVGHESKMWAIAFMPLCIAGLIAVFEKKYWLGFALATFGFFQEISVNHLQITYYTFLIAGFIALAYLFIAIKEKNWKHIGLSTVILGIAALIGVAGNALVLKTTSEYSKFTIRGGKDIEISGDTVKQINRKGLDPDYAFEYSLGKAEVVTIMMPEAFGGGSSEVLKENTKVIDKLTSRGVPENSAVQLAGQLPRYWGGIDGAAGTAGPPYLGAIVCILALIGFVVYKHPVRWGLLAVSILCVLMAYGKYLLGFNTFLLNNLPLYNKFRAPTMALVITQFVLPMMAVLTLHYLFFREKSQELLKQDFKKILIAVGGLIGLLLIMYIGMDYSSPTDKMILNYRFDESGTDEINRLIISGMKADRKAMFGGQVMRTLGFAVLIAGLLWLYLKNFLKPVYVVAIILLASTADLLVVGKKYLDEDKYVPKDSSMSEFMPNSADTEILKDKDPDFRVFNTLGNPYVDSRTPYYHKAVGGYHPAKLRIYQDLIERYLSGNPDRQVLNMLNTKYSIQQNPQTGSPVAVRNPDAFGACWLVKHVSIAPNRVDALQMLGKTNLKDTAVADKDFEKNIVQPQWDSASSIRLTKFDPDAVEYEANCNGPQFAVFSEIYYPKGWNAYVDGKKVEYVNANYVLRGLSIPAGKHAIKFVFEPESVKQGRSIMFIASILVVLIFVGGLFMAWKESPKTTG